MARFAGHFHKEGRVLMRPIAFIAIFGTVLSIVGLSVMRDELAIAGSDKANIAQSQVQIEQVKPGSYQPLNFWEKLKLGSAYFTNARYVEDSKVAYQFNLSSFSGNPHVEDTLLSLAERGKVAFGYEKEGIIYVKSATNLADKFWAMKRIRSDNPEAAKDVYIVAGTSELLGATSAKSLVLTGQPSAQSVPLPRK